MSIQHKKLPNQSSLIYVQGRLDQSQNHILEEQLNQLLQSGYNRLIVDLAETSYINSGGLRCLVSAWRQARQLEGNLVLCGLSARLQEIFSMVGFDKVFTIYTNNESAKQAYQ
ncbi:MAG: STAS domain-containing protein [Anaerolineales bacterium]|nr:STAS domain-containing protein [Anaerolineales bacterium]